MLKYLALFSGMLLLSACFSHKRASKSALKSADSTVAATPVEKKKKAAKPSKFQYGLTRQEVLANIHDRSEIIVAEFNKPLGHLVAYQYVRYGKPLDEGSRYYLYFMNDTLIRKSDPENLYKGARTAIREYYYKK